LAMFLTYTAVVVTDSTLIARELKKQWRARGDSAQAAAGSPAAVAPGLNAAAAETPRTSHLPRPLAVAVALGLIVVLAYAAPIMIGITSPIHLLIGGFALYEAWKLNRGVAFQVTGPYQAAARPAASFIADGRRRPGAGAARLPALRHTDRTRPAGLPILPEPGPFRRPQ